MRWELLLRASLEEEDTPEELLPALYPTRSDSWAHTKKKINTNGARYLTDAVRRSVQATFFRVLSQTGTSLLAVLQSQLASSFFRGTSPSKTLVVINWGMGLQDALRILLHQRAPADLPCQKQVLTIHGVQVLNLQRGQQETGKEHGRTDVRWHKESALQRRGKGA